MAIDPVEELACFVDMEDIVLEVDVLELVLDGFVDVTTEAP